MAGFDNEVLYATNVDFSSGSPVAGKVTLNGQLLIGSTATPNIKVNIPTGSTGVVVTTGSGTLDFGTPTAVQGPLVVADGEIAVFSGGTGQLIRDGLIHIDPGGSTIGTITSNQSASTGTGISITNTNAAATAHAYLTLNPNNSAAGDATVNVNAGGVGWQVGVKGQGDGSFYISSAVSGPAIGGNTQVKIESIGRITFGFGQVVKRTATAISMAVTNAMYYIGVTSTAAPRTITMPAVGGIITGQIWVIKDESGGAATNNITVSGNGVNIDSAATYVINTNYGSVQIMYNGTQFNVY
jgi:hypothetical protein